MNNLSWLIYLADVIPSFSFFLGFIGVIGLIICFICLGLRAIAGSDLSQEDYPTERNPHGSGNYRVWMALRATTSIWVFITLFIMISVSILTPSRQTIYMIAASEIGEQVVTHPDTIDMLKDVKTIIQDNLKAYTKKE